VEINFTTGIICNVHSRLKSRVRPHTRQKTAQILTLTNVNVYSNILVNLHSSVEGLWSTVKKKVLSS